MTTSHSYDCKKFSEFLFIFYWETALDFVMKFSINGLKIGLI